MAGASMPMSSFSMLKSSPVAAFSFVSTLIRSAVGARVQPLMPGLGHGGLPTSWMLPSKHWPHFAPLA
eukprot:6164761-Heterocapsa_arctica.AAC.1